MANRLIMKLNLTKWTRMATAIVMVGIAIFPLGAQVSSSPAFRRYTTQDGLPQMQVERVWQDSWGYIYMGTLSGLVRYDGASFTPFLKGKRYNIVGFAEVERRTWALDFRHRWLVGQDDVEQGELTPGGKWLLNNFNSGDLPEGWVLMEDEQEAHRWLGRMVPAKGDEVTVERLMAHDDFDRMTPDRRLYVDSAWVYIPTDRGLERVSMKGGKAERISKNDSFYALHRWGKVLYAFAQDGIYRVVGDSVKMHTPFDVWQTGYGLIVRDAGKELLIADEHCCYAFDGHEVSKLLGGANLIKDMFIDRWGRLWVATYQGLYCFFGRHFTNHLLTDENDIARALVTDASGRVVMGTLNGKIIVGGHTVVDDPDNFFIPSAAKVEGCVYLAGRNDVACISDTTVSWLGLPYERYQYIVEADGHLILVTRQQIADYDPKTGKTKVLTEEVPHPWCAAADGEGRLWVGSTFGLYALPWHRGGSKNGGGHAAVEKYDFHQQKLIVTTMEADGRGAVFFASGDSLFLIRKGEVMELNSQMPELEGHEVRSLHVSPRGYLLVAAIDGLFVCRVSGDYRLSDVCFFDHTNGFTMIEPLKARMTEAADGTVWMCGVEGMTSLQPAALVAEGRADTIVRPPLRWWQHWWVYAVALGLLVAAVWWLTRAYEKRRHRRKMIRLLHEKHEREQLIRTIREEAMNAQQTELAQDIVKMTDKVETEDQLTLHTTSGMLVVKPADIVYLKANRNYTELATFRGSEIVTMGISTLAAMLKGDNFVRADRSTLVNINYITRLDTEERICIFTSADGVELDTTLMLSAFRRLAADLDLMA